MMQKGNILRNDKRNKKMRNFLKVVGSTVAVLVSLCACGLKLHQSVQNNDFILHKVNHKTASMGVEAVVMRCPLSGKANSGGLIMSCAPLQIVCTSTHRQQAHRRTRKRKQVSSSNWHPGKEYMHLLQPACVSENGFWSFSFIIIMYIPFFWYMYMTYAWCYLSYSIFLWVFTSKFLCFAWGFCVFGQKSQFRYEQSCKTLCSLNLLYRWIDALCICHGNVFILIKGS